MSEVMKDYPIKLFGKTMLQYRLVSDITVPDQIQSSSVTSTSLDSKDLSGGEFTGSRNGYESTNPTEETLTEAATSSAISDYPNDEPSLEKESLSPETGNKEEPNESIPSQEKTLKKPDKIIPCPRCDSMDTKFCYYNNYNVSQPRYFCRNCQRYWTSGGTMRNVPVGSGRRKNKNAIVPHYRHVLVSDNTLHVNHEDAINGIHLSSLNPNSFLVFGSDRPACESMNSNTCVQNELHEGSSESSSAPSNSTENGCPSPYWPSPNSPTSYGPTGFPVAFYPTTPFWGSSVTSPWNVPWFSTSSCTLGKHSREGNMTRPSNLGNENLTEKMGTRRSVLVPKTLRIHDPNEAAKSSIWSTLGIKNERIGSINGTSSLFKAFEPKGHRHSSIDNTKMILQANPAALSRSVNFHESA